MYREQRAWQSRGWCWCDRHRLTHLTETGREQRVPTQGEDSGSADAEAPLGICSGNGYSYTSVSCVPPKQTDPRHCFAAARKMNPPHGFLIGATRQAVPWCASVQCLVFFMVTVALEVLLLRESAGGGACGGTQLPCFICCSSSNMFSSSSGREFKENKRENVAYSL